MLPSLQAWHCRISVQYNSVRTLILLFITVHMFNDMITGVRRSTMVKRLETHGILHKVVFELIIILRKRQPSHSRVISMEVKRMIRPLI